MQRKGAALRAALKVDERLSAGSGEGVLEAPDPPALPTATGSSRGGGKPPPPVIPDFAPVPRRYRHDGWTPERQKAFIEALADTGCVDRAARMVNMAQTNCYTLRRAAGAEGFRRAWDAALDFGLKRLKDIAFERAIEGQLVPVFVAGKLMGFRRKRNDALLMFCLRHYGQDSQGRRTTINYFSTRASAGAVGAGAGSLDCARDERGLSQAEASTTTVRTVISGGGLGGDGAGALDTAAAALNGFEGVALDAEAEAAIAAALAACAARARSAEAARERGGLIARDAEEADPDVAFVRVRDGEMDWRGELELPGGTEEVMLFGGDEGHWTQTGAEKPEWVARIEEEREQAALPRPRRKREKRAAPPREETA